jgi:hypothetical protein
MSRNKTIVLLLFAAYCTSGLASCAKKQEPDTPFTKIMGRWKLTKFASDAGNGPLIYTPFDKAVDWKWFFDNDSKGYDIQSWNGQEGIKEVYEFRIVGADSIRIATTTHDTSIYFIAEINSSDMVWTKSHKLPNGNPVTEGYFFSRE